jgi:hypothetical protein
VRNSGYTFHIRLRSPVITKEKVVKKDILGMIRSENGIKYLMVAGPAGMLLESRSNVIDRMRSRFAHWDKNRSIRDGERLSSLKMIFSYRMGIPVSYQ